VCQRVLYLPWVENSDRHAAQHRGRARVELFKCRGVIQRCKQRSGADLALGDGWGGGNGVDAAEGDEQAAELGAVFEAHADGLEAGLVGADEAHHGFHTD
jgi:hypothetical protein